MKKTLSLWMALCLLLGLLTACGTSPTESTDQSSTPAEDVVTDTDAGDAATDPAEPSPEAADTASVFPLCEEGEITLEWLEKGMDSQLVKMEPDNSQNVMFRELTKLTGITFAFNYISTTSFNEQFNLMLVAQDYPDIANVISPDNCGASGDMAYEDGVIIRLNEYEDIMPNYMSYINADDVSRRNAYTDEGNLLTFYQIYNRLQPAFLGYVIRQDWLDDLGLAMPETIDEWHDTLVAFQSEKTAGGAAPMDLPANGMPLFNFFQAAFGLNTGSLGSGNYFIQKDGVVSCSMTDPGLRSYLETLAQWYQEGLINRDFVSGESADVRVAANESGAFQTLYSLGGSRYAELEKADPEAFFALAPVPTLEKGVANQVGAHGEYASVMVANGAVVFASCAYVEEAVRLLDWLYSDEGNLLSNYGVEGETFYRDEDGTPFILEEFSDRQVYMMHSGAKIFNLDVEENAADPYTLCYYDVWNDEGAWNLDGNISFTVDEAEERARVMADLTTQFEEFCVKVIAGMITLDDDTWSDYLDTMASLGVDTATEITQQAYDRFLAR